MGDKWSRRRAVVGDRVRITGHSIDGHKHEEGIVKAVYFAPNPVKAIMREAADRITTLERELAEARKERDSYERLYLNEIERASSIDDDLAASQAEVERLRAALKPFAKVADMLVFSGATTANEIELSGEQLFGALMAARAAITRQGETG